MVLGWCGGCGGDGGDGAVPTVLCVGVGGRGVACACKLAYICTL